MAAKVPPRLALFFSWLAVALRSFATSEGLFPRSPPVVFGRPQSEHRNSAGPKCLGSAKESKCQSELEALRAWHAEMARGNPVAWRKETNPNAGDASLAQPAPPHPSALGSGRRPLQDSAADENLRSTLESLEEELKKVADMMADLREELKLLTYIKSRQDFNLSNNPRDFSGELLTNELMAEARDLVSKCNGNGFIISQPVPTWKGYSCSASEEAVAKFLDYPMRGTCPDDWPHTQSMIFVENCHALPKRRCLTLTSPNFREPLPLPQSLFNQDALMDENVRWTKHECKSFDCLNKRLVGDCRNCFLMNLEARRWRRSYRGSLPMKDVIEMKKGSLRIGLDAGGGSGSFAAHMALYGVTVMTTAMNIETVKGRSQGLPYMETIALRGLIPLHVPHKARLPFFDNTLDIIHCVNSVKYLPILEFEELLFEWDRVLRVGGVMWFEMFYAPMDEMPVYIALIEQLGYRKLHWNVMPKPDYGERVGLHVYLNCVIEKPVRKEHNSWFG